MWQVEGENKCLQGFGGEKPKEGDRLQGLGLEM